MRLATIRTRLWSAAACAVAALVVAATAGGAPTAADFAVEIGAHEAPNDGRGWKENGGTATVSKRSFYVYVRMAFLTPNARGSATARLQLSEGLRWGEISGNNPTPECRSTSPTTGQCRSEEVHLPTNAWTADVVAAAPGRYTYTAELVELSDTDPSPANNRSTITIVVAESSGGGGGGGGTASARASAARLTPARPKAGARVTAAVRVTAGGSPIRPTAVACTGSIGSAKLAGTPRASSGSATCAYRTPASARGKMLRGAVSFTARGQRFTKRFSARLG